MCTPEPLYNTLSYNTVLDITLITTGPQLLILDYFCYIPVHLWPIFAICLYILLSL